MSRPPGALKLLGESLMRDAGYLAPLAPKLAARWSHLYLVTFGRDAFFQQARVQNLFSELVDLFVKALKHRDFDRYFDDLRERGRLFARLALPFEEMIISMHLFEQSALEEFFESYPRRAELPALLSAMEEFHSRALAALAASYFETVKGEVERVAEGLAGENDELRRELAEAKHSIFTLAQSEISSMHSAISSVNAKLKNRVYQLSRIQRMQEALVSETYIPKLLRIASNQLLVMCPPASDVYFGFFDDERKWTSVYHLESEQEKECELVRRFYYSELPKAFQDAIYDPEKRFQAFRDPADIPEYFREGASIRGQKEFLVIPINKYADLVGFVFMAVTEDHFFNKHNGKFFQRLGQTLSSSILSALLFNESKKNEQYQSVRQELVRRDIQKEPHETLLDFYLGSLMDLMGAERSSLMRFDDQKKELSVYAAKGRRVFPIGGLKLKWGEGVAGLALKQTRPIAISRMKEAPPAGFFGKFFASGTPRQNQVKSLLCLPLVKDEKPLGVINLSTVSFFKDFEAENLEITREFTSRLSTLLETIPIEAETVDL